MKLARLFLLFSFAIIQNCIAQTLSSPESIVYDESNQRYLISNTTSGQILTMNSQKVYGNFVSNGLTNPKGMCIDGTTLYVVDINYLKAFNKGDGTSVLNFPVQGSVFLNDLCTDNSGFLYMTDMSKNCIYKYSIADQTTEVLSINGTLKSPNGIYFDAPQNSLYVVSFTKPAQIAKVNLSDLNVEITDLPNINYLDGITKDSKGNFFISSWTNMSTPANVGIIYRFSADNPSALQPISDHHSGPADIFYNIILDELAIPNFANNTITFVNYSGVDDGNIIDTKFIKLSPNPVDIKADICISIPFTTSFDLTVYNSYGIKAANIDSRANAYGKYTYEFNTKNFDSGIYFLILRFGAYSEIEKFLIIK